MFAGPVILAAQLLALPIDCVSLNKHVVKVICPTTLKPPACESLPRRLIRAQEEERKRLARDLHDGVGQTLLIIKNRAFLAGQGPGAPSRVVEQLKEISDLAMQAIEEVREISAALRPFQLDWLGLTKAIRAMFATIGRAGGFKIVADIESLDGLFPPEDEI